MAKPKTPPSFYTVIDNDEITLLQRGQEVTIYPKQDEESASDDAAEFLEPEKDTEIGHSFTVYALIPVKRYVRPDRPPVPEIRVEQF
jgi:hypothetical protein